MESIKIPASVAKELNINIESIPTAKNKNKPKVTMIVNLNIPGANGAVEYDEEFNFSFKKSDWKKAQKTILKQLDKVIK